MQQQEEGVEITANSLHPGAIATNLLRHHGFVEGEAPIFFYKFDILFKDDLKTIYLGHLVKREPAKAMINLVLFIFSATLFPPPAKAFRD